MIVKIGKAEHDCRILVTPTSFGRSDLRLKRTLEETVGEVIYNTTGRPLEAEELRDLLPGVDGFIAGLDKIDASVIQAADVLQVITRYGVGVDRVDLAAATARGIVVTNTPGANSQAVAELTIGLMLILARHICAGNQSVRQGEWPRNVGIGLQGKTVGLVGLGTIGREVAARLHAFGCEMLASDPNVSAEEAGTYDVQMVPLTRLLGEADFVSLHSALLPSTRGMVDRAFLAQLKPGAVLINTARGEMINEEALQEALESGHLTGAALDCFAQEPPGVEHPLLRLPQVIVTPHIGAHTDQAMNRMGWMALESCLAVLRGERPTHIVNPEVTR